MSILHLTKSLCDSGPRATAGSIQRRNVITKFALPGKPAVAHVRFCREHDLESWLALRNDAVADLKPMPRPWTEDDFYREMTAKDWWFEDCTQVAESNAGELIGSVTLARRGNLAVMHWLIVVPAWRRRGIAQLLVAHCERLARQRGHIEIRVETHGNWKAAVALYRRLGYVAA